MANRVLRDWTGSKKISKLSPLAERFFTRLIMKVDDFGCYPADPVFLKSTLFPLIEDLPSKEVEVWLNDCKVNGLIVVYVINEEVFLQIQDFKQRLRQAKGKYPLPIDGQLTDNGRLETKRNEEETEVEEETNCAHGIENSDFKYDVPVPREATDLVEAICDYFEVKKILTSKIYNSIDDFVRTAMHRNELAIVSLALQKYMAYKARSQEAKHNVLNWIGTKDNHYSDGHWNTTDWSLKLKNSNNHASTERKTTAASAIVQPGKRFR